MVSFRRMVWGSTESTPMPIAKFGRTCPRPQWPKSLVTSGHSPMERQGLIWWCLSASNAALKQMHFLWIIRIEKRTHPLCSRTFMEILSRRMFSIALAKGRENSTARKEATWPEFRQAIPSTSLRSSSLFAKRSSWRSKLWLSQSRETLPISLMCWTKARFPSLSQTWRKTKSWVWVAEDQICKIWKTACHSGQLTIWRRWKNRSKRTNKRKEQ